MAAIIQRVALAILLVTLVLLPTYSYAENRVVIQVDLIEAPKGNCADLTDEKHLTALKVLSPLISPSEIESFSWANQSLTLSAQATKRLFSNAAEFEAAGDDSIIPKGAFFDLKDGWFLFSLGGKRRFAGRIASSFEQLQNPPPCALLYPGLPNVLNGKMVVAFGKPRSRQDLHEDFFKVLIEEGPVAAFETILPVELKKP